MSNTSGDQAARDLCDLTTAPPINTIEPMEEVLSMLLEAAIQLAASLLDWSRWWRLTLCVIISVIGSAACYPTGNSGKFGFLPSVALPVLGITVGLIWEYKTQE